MAFIPFPGAVSKNVANWFSGRLNQLKPIISSVRPS